MFGPACSGSMLVIRTDNAAAEAVINSGRSSNLAMQPLLRVLGRACADFRVVVYAMHISSTDNVFADACSRGRVHVRDLQALAGSRLLRRLGHN